MKDGRKTALVIGASSVGGLGEAVARRLAADGASVIVAGRRMDALETLAGGIGGTALACDMLDEDSIAQAVSAAGPIDILVNAAGTTDFARLSRIIREQIEAQFAMHVTANMLLLKHATATIRPGGSIVLFSSITAKVAGQGLAAYSCAKAAIDHLVRIAALELGEQEVRVNAVAPGFARTPMVESIFAHPPVRDLYLRDAALAGRSVTPDEVAATVAWLASDLCFATGETIQISGGAQLGRLPRLDELKHARRA